MEPRISEAMGLTTVATILRGPEAVLRSLPQNRQKTNGMSIAQETAARERANRHTHRTSNLRLSRAGSSSVTHTTPLFHSFSPASQTDGKTKLVAVMHPSPTPSPACLQGSISFNSSFHPLITTTRSGLHSGSISLQIRAASPQLQISP
ncbi:hypothetical protein EYF80_014594 [Liparis tanakae]|uniref:Uncharacterized protein n=1 Tax=Liparis tanakae TaxID=230148 RepID=A0A4Z2ICU0_9TELE|nr:hypothetical protein EYF80_014594 [Liparis tanakae]